MSRPAGSGGRLARLVERLADHGLDGLLVRHLPNVRYLTGFTGSNAWLLVRAERSLFGTDGRYETQVAEELSGIEGLETIVARERLSERFLERVTAELAGEAVGFESDRVSHAEWAALGEHARAVDWRAVSGLVEDLRAVKDPEEVERIERAARIAIDALRETLTRVGSGDREFDLAAELEYRIRRSGAEGPAFETIVASGPRSALPHAPTSDRALRAGELLLIDFGAALDGYRCDLTRTFAVGDADGRMRDLYGRVRAAREAALGVLREGSTGSEVDAAARASLEAVGLADRFAHSTGHGLGLEVHEAPRLHRRGEESLRRGMVVTVEPGLYFAGWGGIRIEDDFLVTGDGPRVLGDPAPPELPILAG